MEMNLQGRNFLCIEDFTPDELRYLLDLAHELKAEKKGRVDQRRFVGKNLLMLFDLSSTRTRCSFETSASDLGMGSTFLSNSHFGAKETIKDSMRVFNGLYDVAMYRGARHEPLLEMAKYAKIPLINGYTSHQHPTQMLADMMTLEELWGRNGFKGKTFCYVGRGGDCLAYSYGVMCAMFGMNFKFITSFKTLEESVELLSADERSAFNQYLADGGKINSWSTHLEPDRRAVIEELFKKYSPECSFEETDDLNAVKGADVLSTENWGFFTDPPVAWLPGIRKYMPYQVNQKLLERTGNPDVVFIHMLPATHNAEHSAGQALVRAIKDPELAEFLSKGFEVTDEVFEKYADVIFREAENRQHTIKAVLQAVAGR